MSLVKHNFMLKKGNETTLETRSYKRTGRWTGRQLNLCDPPARLEIQKVLFKEISLKKTLNFFEP